MYGVYATVSDLPSEYRKFCLARHSLNQTLNAAIVEAMNILLRLKKIHIRNRKMGEFKSRMRTFAEFFRICESCRNSLCENLLMIQFAYALIAILN